MYITFLASEAINYQRVHTNKHKFGGTPDQLLEFLTSLGILIQ